ncbi:MAG: tetratricopeptide repeat protein [Reichenbachiella sp.]
MKRSIIAFFSTLIFIPFFSYAQLGTAFKATYISEPGIRLDANKIAILEFEDENDTRYSYGRNKSNSGSTKIPDYIVSQLLKKNRGVSDAGRLYFKGMKTNLYTIVERDQLDKVIQEQKLGVSGAIDDASAAEVGKLLGIDVIITGSTSYTSSFDKDRSSYKNKEGVVKYTYSIQREVIMESRIKIISIGTGEILGTQGFSTIKRDSESSSKSYPSESTIKTTEVLKSDAYKPLAGYIANYLAPRFSTQNQKLVKIKNKEYKARAKEAVDHLKENRLDKGYAMYQALYDEDPYNPEFAYNIAILYEGTGSFDKAKESANIAYEIDPDNATYEKVKKRINATVDYLDFLADTKNIEILPYEFSNASSKIGNKVMTKGNSKTRYPVYTEMSEQADVVLKVPGGLTFEVLENNGDWVKIKLVGGREGYLPKASLK